MIHVGYTHDSLPPNSPPKPSIPPRTPQFHRLPFPRYVKKCRHSTYPTPTPSALTAPTLPLPQVLSQHLPYSPPPASESRPTSAGHKGYCPFQAPRPSEVPEPAIRAIFACRRSIRPQRKVSLRSPAPRRFSRVGRFLRMHHDSRGINT